MSGADAPTAEPAPAAKELEPDAQPPAKELEPDAQPPAPSAPTGKEVKPVHFDKFVQTLPSMEGKTVAVTGSTSGTGLIFAQTCAMLGAKVILLNRTSARSEKAFSAVKAAAPDCKLMSYPCDLQSFKSVRAAAALMIASCPEGLDVLCNNAGIMTTPNIETEDSFNSEMQANHLSHFLLTAEVWPLLEKAVEERGEARVINHSSIARNMAFPLCGGFSAKYVQADVSRVGGDGTFGRLRRYAQTKLANTLFTHALATKQSKVKVLAAHPGVAKTSLMDNTIKTSDSTMSSAWLLSKAMAKMRDSEVQSQEDGTLGILSAACLPNVESDTIWGPAKSAQTGPAVPEPIAGDYWFQSSLESQTETLWHESLKATSAKFPF
jgi:NAD(P)-dependent dehydrogenase (short-subunit alcohol dehydrogenase family)